MEGEFLGPYTAQKYKIQQLGLCMDLRNSLKDMMPLK